MGQCRKLDGSKAPNQCFPKLQHFGNHFLFTLLSISHTKSCTGPSQSYISSTSFLQILLAHYLIGRYIPKLNIAIISVNQRFPSLTAHQNHLGDHENTQLSRPHLRPTGSEPPGECPVIFLKFQGKEMQCFHIKTYYQISTKAEKVCIFLLHATVPCLALGARRASHRGNISLMLIFAKEGGLRDFFLQWANKKM
jgi:hypothetical protein